MLGPENPVLGKRTAKTLGGSPAALYVYVENVDKVVAKANGLRSDRSRPGDGHVLG